MQVEETDGFLLGARADGPDVARAALVVEQAAWTGLGFLNYTKASYDHYEMLLQHYADYQLALIDPRNKYVVAAGNCVPLYCEDFSELPDDGWDWAVRTAAATMDRKPNMLVGLAISVPRVHRGKGLARQVIKGMGALAEAKGLAGPFIPVRPSAKHLYPEVDIAEYVEWKTDAGAPSDPWLRSHVAMGATVLGPCARSMTVEEPIGFWESWTGRQFDSSGPATIDGCLVPVEMDLDAGIGRYVEPNVWVSYAH
jgi:predicted GNAT family acetyltransferase